MVKSGARVAEEGASTGPRRGRPRNATVEQAILRATVELLSERGFDRFTVQDIAERAGAGLGAIYRRWPSKLDVVVAAIRTLADYTPPTPTGNIEEDLARLLESRVLELRGCLGAILPGLLSAMHEHPDLAEFVETASIGPVLETNRSVLAPAFPDPAELQLRAELINAVLLYRLLVTQDLPDRREIRHRLVPLILGRPLSTRTGTAKKTLPGRPRRKAVNSP
jgi:AcrR family transcriptional regulator